MENISGLMSAGTSKSSKSSPLLAQFRAALSPSGVEPRTLEQRLAELSDAERKSLIQTAKLVQMGLRMRVASNDYSVGYLDMVNTMYGGMAIDKRQLIAELLDETAPLEFVPQPKPKRSSQEDALSFYERPEFQVSPQSEPTQAEDDTASTLEAVLAEVFPEPQLKPQPKQSQVAVGKDAFVKAYTPVAKEVAADLGVSYKVVLAQAALESGWGKSVKGNGLMGVKSHGASGGQTFTTHEEINGKRVKITDSFRQYDTPEDSVRGYAKFMKANPRYRYFLAAGQENEEAQLMALQESGYATDSNYAQKLKAIIKGLPSEGSA